jgi:hypothetical protein
MPVDLDTGQKITGRHGFLVPIDGGDTLLSTCRRHGDVWIAGSDKPQSCNGFVRGDALAMLDIDLKAAAMPDVHGSTLPTVLSTSRFTMSKPTIANAAASDMAAIRADEPSLPRGAAIQSITVGKAVPLYVASTRYLPDGNGGDECATTARAVFVRRDGRMVRLGELPDQPTSVVNADRPYLIVPVDCGKRIGIWVVGAKLEQVGYLDNGYEYGG